ncbi:hypothetical protein GCM10007894_20980 [Paraferrimonas haliotis]|uniref:tRNA/rRNA methyltransferase SpoU type domain-containing protein n=1 Tax=Paraferrimonas haliotis TaxID=2013866 RepID=A0AA37TTS5_9GAMM|nr:hypothetical protein GCM10007894_20980 [Paraferrimonas haliotis]
MTYTGERYQRAARYQTDTHQHSQHIELSHVDNVTDGLEAGEKLICVDLVEGATALSDYCHPAHARYVFGPEDGSISQEVIDRADAVVYIPTNACLNLAASVNVLLYDRMVKLGSIHASDELIIKSRDINNRTKVR